MRTASFDATRSTASCAGQKLLEEHPDAVWFMDYRNGDGSIAEMCGNGVRAFVEYLRTRGLIELRWARPSRLGTRAGVKTVARTEEGYTRLIWVRGASSFTVTLPARGGEGLPEVCSRPEDLVLACPFRWVTRTVVMLGS